MKEAKKIIVGREAAVDGSGACEMTKDYGESGEKGSEMK
jgi:hypothetical protein